MIPPYCTNPECAMHDKEHANERFYARIGSHATKHAGRVQRFRCKRCGKTFSERSFDIDYYVKKPFDYAYLAKRLKKGDTLSSIAYALGCSWATAKNRAERLLSGKRPEGRRPSRLERKGGRAA